MTPRLFPSIDADLLLYQNRNTHANATRTSMTIWPTLSHAPIVEGLIDIRVERSASVTVDNLRLACDELAAEFSSRTELRHLTGQISLSTQALPSISTSVDEHGGFVLRSTDEKWVVQFRLDGFTISRLQPYGSWDELRTKASVLWKRYSEVSNPTKVLRIASRFINRVPLPPGESLDNTFLTNFVLGPNLPQTVAGYLLRVVIPFDEHDAVAIVTQSVDGNGTDCILDLDTFSEHPQGISEDAIWGRLDSLRDVKNRLFFGSFTEPALERFK